MNTQQELINQAGAVIRMGEKVLSTESAEHRLTPMVNEELFHTFRISALSFLTRVFGEESVHSQSLKTEVTHPTASRTRRGLGILHAACDDLRGGWLEKSSAVLSREILGDLLRLASLHMAQGHRLAAVVVAASVLEQLLRQLSSRHGLNLCNESRQGLVPPPDEKRPRPRSPQRDENRLVVPPPQPKRALQLCGELYRKKVLNRQENKGIIGWLELAERAAAEPATEVNGAEVQAMLKGVETLLGKKN